MVLAKLWFAVGLSCCSHGYQTVCILASTATVNRRFEDASNQQRSSWAWFYVSVQKHVYEENTSSSAAQFSTSIDQNVAFRDMLACIQNNTGLFVMLLTGKIYDLHLWNVRELITLKKQTTFSSRSASWVTYTPSYVMSVWFTTKFVRCSPSKAISKGFIFNPLCEYY